jgi:hypothetical protein
MVYNGARIIDSSKQPMPGKSRSYLLAREGLSGLETASKVSMIERHPEGDNRKALSPVDLSGWPPLWPEGDSLVTIQEGWYRGRRPLVPGTGMGGFCIGCDLPCTGMYAPGDRERVEKKGAGDAPVASR